MKFEGAEYLVGSTLQKETPKAICRFASSAKEGI